MHFNSITTEEFIKRAKLVHGDLYEYDNVEYTKSSNPVKILCSIHGEFSQRPNDHVSGKGCKKCGAIQRSMSKRLNARNKFVDKATKKHGKLYDYNSVNYVNTRTKISILCNKHDEYFEQLPSAHLKGHGCPICGNEIIKFKQTSNTYKFVKKSKTIHGDIYDYSEVKYEKSNIKVKIFCNYHNEYFWQRPNCHLMGKGCFRCGRGKLTENLFESLIAQYYPNLEYLRDESQPHLWRDKSRKFCRYDFYFPELMLNIELDGRQHYEPIKFFGGIDKFKKLQESDVWKDQQSSKFNITVIRIPYFDFSYHKTSESELYFSNSIVPKIDSVINNMRIIENK